MSAARRGAKRADVPALVEISAEANQILTVIETRWNREHLWRGENPLIDQVFKTIELLEATPEIGTLVRRRDHVAIRRWRVPSGWFIYYSYDRHEERVVIKSIWWAGRRRGPRLK